YGFINKHISELGVEAQNSSMNLVTGQDGRQKFQLKPDLSFKMDGNQWIADTKYKLVYTNEKDTKNGISQSDLYQMVAYAIRFKSENIILFYPNNVGSDKLNSDTLERVDEFSNTTITIHLHQIPIYDEEVLESDLDTGKDLSSIFQNLEGRLKKALESALKQTVQ
ncbi:MAG: hypothetical protein RIF34_08355, partial [Candidatus Kapaibacterium sp.]